MPRNDGTGFRLIIILIITFLCLGISFIQMMRGYKEFGGQFISGVFSFVVVLILFYLIFELHKARKEGRSVLGIMVWYLFFVLLSFAGNFNSFYTFFMKNELLKTELNEKHLALLQLRADAESTFIPQELSKLLSRLKFQILSETEPGCGPKCAGILEEIKANEEIKTIKGSIKFEPIKSSYKKNDPPDKRKKSLEDLYNGYRKLIVGDRETAILDEMNTDYPKLQPEVDAALKAPDLYAQETIKKIVDRYNQDAVNIKQIAGANFKRDTNLIFDNAEVGKISQTFNSASHHLNHWGTWISAFTALMIDLFVPIFILGFTKSGQKQSFSFGKRGAENLS